MSIPVPLAARGPAARAALKRRLDRLYATFDRTYLETDPLAFVHRYREDADREIVAFVAAGLAFGNVRAIVASLTAVLASFGSSPSRFVDGFDPARDGHALHGLYHRWIRSVDLARLASVLGRMRARSGSIGAFFLEGYAPGDADIGGSLASFSERALALAAAPPDSGCSPGDAAGSDQGDEPDPSSDDGPGQRPEAEPLAGPGSAGGWGAGAGSVAKFFPSPRDGSACKRLNLFLRWMVRDGDGLDLGLWTEVSRRQLVLPLDTHLVRLTRALGLTDRRSPGWAMAVEATRSLALLDPDDPVKYDFSLSRLGILDLCLHGRDALDCRTCAPPRVVVKRRGSRSRRA